MTEPSIAADTRPWRSGAEAPFIRIRSVTKSFGAVTAVNDVSLDIWKGELFCLLGGSGCGKTTLLRMLAGFETPTAGTIELDGQDVAGVPPHERPTNMMFQSYALFPHMSVARNVGYGLRRDGIAKGEIADRVEEILNLVQLSGLQSRKPHQLSGGQRQRVALARALVKRPKLLLLDEPLGALDKKLREETQFELVNIQETLGVTFIVVTHDQEEAMTLATRIGVMDAGRIVQIGEPHAVYETPANRFVADFIGSVNMMQGKVVSVDESSVTVQTAEADAIKAPARPGVKLGAQVWYAVRPEKLDLSLDRPDSSNVVTGVVDDVAYLGGQSIYRIRLDNGALLRAAIANRSRDAQSISWDDTVHVSWPKDAAVVLTE